MEDSNLLGNIKKVNGINQFIKSLNVSSFFSILLPVIAQATSISPDLFQMVSQGVGVTSEIIEVLASIAQKTLLNKQNLEETIIQSLKSDFEKCVKDTVNLLIQQNNKSKCGELKEEQKDSVINYIININNIPNPSYDIIKSSAEQVLEKLDISYLIELSEEFYAAFRTCLYSYPSLNAALLRTQSSDLATSFELFIGNEFINKLSVLSNRDGIMSCFSNIFSNYFLSHPINSKTINYLSKIQDEYNKLFLLDESHLRSINLYANNLSNLLISNESIDVRENCDGLISFYLDYISAEQNYYEGFFSKAIEKYTKLLHEIECNELEKLQILDITVILRKIKVYISNSLGWSYHRNNENMKAIEIYRKYMDYAEKEYPSSGFMPRLYSNYGVCLTNDKQYLEALRKYQVAIDQLSVDSNEYKVYINFCSTLMRQWDIDCGKLDGLWDKKAIGLYNTPKSLFTSDNVKKIKTYLLIAQQKKAFFSDIYVQRIKLYTYIILISDRLLVPKYIELVDDLLLLLDTIAHDEKGVIFVSRDYYYALYLKETDLDQKRQWANRCKTLNDELSGLGDSIQFSKLLL